MTTQALRGKIEPLALVDVLAYLGRNRESGVLNVTRDKTEKSIVIDEGNIIFARSNQTEDRLGDILLSHGLINQAQYDEGTELLKKKGFRHGRALVEIGAISPKTLWNTIQSQIELIACSVIPWENGTFEFIKKSIKQKESITVRKPILDLVLDVVRNLDNRFLFRSRFPSPDQLFRKVEGPHPYPIDLDPHERYLLKFVDGRTPLNAICARSDFGKDETLRVIYLLRALGCIESVPIVEPEDSIVQGPIHPLIDKYNRIFQYIHQYLADRVGTVGTSILKKYFKDTLQTHPSVFEGVQLKRDGRLNAPRIQVNLHRLEQDHEKEKAMLTVDDALNEYLNMGVLAVKKVLGTDHESTIIQHIGSMT